MRDSIYVIGYWHKNLGDDLFLKILCERYSESDFYVVSNDDYDHMLPNLSNKGNRLLNKLLRLLSREHISLSSLYESGSDFTIVLGGSIFIESDQPYKKMLKRNSTYYVLGANFGPYHSKEYFEYHKNFLSAAKDVCFREKKSKELFKDLPVVRVEADIVFGLDLKCSTENEGPAGQTGRRNAVISVMNFRSHPEIDHVLYEKLMAETAGDLHRRGYEVTLMSFCSFEGDEEAVCTLKELCSKENVPVKTYCYRGDMEEALEVLQASEVVLAARYHAAILGILMEKKVAALAYSDKTIHVLDDIGFKGLVLDLRELSASDRLDVDELTARNCSVDLDKIRQSARRQFMVLDKDLMKRAEISIDEEIEKNYEDQRETAD